MDPTDIECPAIEISSRATANPNWILVALSEMLEGSNHFISNDLLMAMKIEIQEMTETDTDARADGL